MKTNLQIYFICLSVWFFNASWAFADTLVFSNGRIISGTVLQTNDDDILLLTGYAAFNFSKSNIKEIKIEPAETAQSLNTDRIPDFKKVLLLLSQQPWATNLMPIPATVVDKGILRNVPYSSFRCGEDYEVNVYGDLDHPAGIEIGIYLKLLGDDSAKSNCMTFVSSLLNEPTDKAILQELDLKKDLKMRDELTFEITPPTAEDAYNGWWVSLYSEQKLNLARASDNELKAISMTEADATKAAGQGNSSAWSTEELKHARHPSLGKITFTNKSGQAIMDADVVRITDGVSLVWEKDGGANSGMVRLEDLPDELRVRFGYNAAKTTAADELARQRRAKRAAEEEAYAPATQAVPQNQDYGGYSGYSDSSSYSGGGSVYVHGYYRSNGTYVNAYSRSYPHSH
jgi:hypothetical protein